MYDEPRYLPAGDRSLVVEFGNEISEDVSGMVRRFSLALARYAIPGVGEVVPTYRSVAVYFDPLAVRGPDLVEELRAMQARIMEFELPPARTVRVPTVYGGEYGPDLVDVAAHNGITPAEVIAVHTAGTYLIYMLGFTPGFAYLGGLPERIACPRLANPRERIPAGSVGIAGSQTGIYPIDSPGGWRLIGRTPLRLYDPTMDPPVLLQAGDHLQFFSINEAEFDAIAAGITAGTYRPEVVETAPPAERGRAQ